MTPDFILERAAIMAEGMTDEQYEAIKRECMRNFVERLNQALSLQDHQKKAWLDEQKTKHGEAATQELLNVLKSPKICQKILKEWQ